MTDNEIAGYKFSDEDRRGECPDDGGVLVNVPHMIHTVEVSEKDLSDFDAGLWGIGWCPFRKHFHIWKLAAFDSRPGATEDNPLGYPLIFPLDKETGL